MYGDSWFDVQDKEHEDAMLEVKELDVLDPPNKTPKHRPLLENAIHKDGYVHYSTETDITHLVRQYLGALIKAGGLGPKIQLSATYYTAKSSPDVLIVYNDRHIPCGVVDVELPGSPDRQSNAAVDSASELSDRMLRSSANATVQQQPKDSGPLESERIHGQIFNYLHIFRTFYNVEHPFGILTTYEEWRVCWLKEGEANNRVFEGTAIMHYNHPELHKTIMTALVHMSKPPNPQAKSLHERVGTYFPYIDKDGLTWRQLTKQPNDDEFPGPNSSEFMLLEPAGTGTEGYAWIACNTSWKLCVLNAFIVKDKETITRVLAVVKEELEIWKKVFGVKIFSVMLAGTPAIVMPRHRLALAPGENTLSLQDGDVEAVREAVTKYAQSGKEAMDLNWYRVGFLEKNAKNGKLLKKKVAIFIDSRPENCTDREVAEGRMLWRLGLEE